MLSTNGDTYLGGDDFDRAIVNYWIDKSGLTTDKVNADKKLSQEFRLAAEEAKIYLSHMRFTQEKLLQYKVELDKKEFEKLIQTFVDKTIDCCKNALKDAALTINDIDEVVMVGGSTRVPLVKKSVAIFLKDQFMIHLIRMK